MMIGSLARDANSIWRAEDFVLRFAWRVVVKIIEADFAPGDYLGMFGQLRQLFEHVWSNLFRLMRMHADGGVDPVVAFGVGDGGVHLFRAGAGADRKDGLDSGGLGAGEHGVAVLGELGEVDVGV